MLPWQILLSRLIHDRPCLYDKSNKDFADVRGAKVQKWAEVVQGMIDGGYSIISGVPVDAAYLQKKWRNMRDHFVRSLKQDVSETTKLAYMQSPNISDYSNFSITDDTPSIDTEEDMSKVQDTSTASETVLVTIAPDPNSSPANIITASGGVATQGNVVMTHQRPKPKYIQSLRKKLNLKRPIQPKPESSPEVPAKTVAQASPVREIDEDKLFGQLIEKRLRVVPDGQSKERLKVEILRMIFETQYPTDQPKYEQTVDLQAAL